MTALVLGAAESRMILKKFSSAFHTVFFFWLDRGFEVFLAPENESQISFGPQGRIFRFFSGPVGGFLDFSLPQGRFFRFRSGPKRVGAQIMQLVTSKTTQKLGITHRHVDLFSSSSAKKIN